MEKIIKKIPHYKEVRTGFYEKEMFVSTDGKEFTTEKQCITWEKQLEENMKWEAIEKISFELDVFRIPDLWFFPKTEEELKRVKDNNCYKGDSVTIHGTWTPNQWIGVDRDDYDNGAFVIFVTRDHLINTINAMKNKLESELKDGE